MWCIQTWVWFSEYHLQYWKMVVAVISWVQVVMSLLTKLCCSWVQVVVNLLTKTVLIYYVLYVIDFVCSITATGNCSSDDTELQRYPLLAEMYIEDIPLPRDGTKRSNTIVLTASRARRFAESFRCQRCGNFYTYKKNLLRHLNLECGKEPQFQCPYCPKKAKHKNHLLRHIKSQHAANVWIPYRELWSELIGCFPIV